MNRTYLAVALCMTLSAGAVGQDKAPTCADLRWSVLVLEENPDIAKACRGVYRRQGELYAQIAIELIRVRGNRLTFRPLLTDGTKGSLQSIQVSNSWRAEIGGNSYRASELLPGQQLNVYVPEDRFALAVDDGDFDGTEEIIEIERAETTVSPESVEPAESH